MIWFRTLAAVLVGTVHTTHAMGQDAFLKNSSPEEWEQAIQWTMSSNHLDAIRLFKQIERKERINPDASYTELARYYTLHNLAKLGRFSDIEDQWSRLDSSRLPESFQADARRLIALGLLESGKIEEALDHIQQSLTKDVGEDGRLRLLQGRAQAQMGMTSEAIDAITVGLFSGGNVPTDEKQKAVAILLQILEQQGRLAEVERLDRIFGAIWSERK